MSEKTRPDGVTILSLWYFVLSGGALFGSCVTLVPIGLISMSDMPTGGRLLASLLLGVGVTITLPRRRRLRPHRRGPLEAGRMG